MKYKFLIFSFISVMFCSELFAQQNQDYKRLQRRLNADSIVQDSFNGDGVFIARSKKTQKWGMFQGFGKGKPQQLVPFNYDSLGFFDQSPNFTIVKKNQKYGLILSPWSNDGSLESIRCTYDKLAIIESDYSRSHNMIAAQKNGKWGYIHEETGATLIPFQFTTIADLPDPDQEFYTSPIEAFSPEMMAIFNRPDTITQLDLSYKELSFVPKPIRQCTKLTFLNLEGNQLKTIPKEVGELKNLTDLYIGFNPKLLGGYNQVEALGFIQDLPKLEHLILGNSSYNKSPRKLSYCEINLPKDFKFPNSLKSLSIGCGFSEFPESIYQLPNLNKLNLTTAFPNQTLDFRFEDLASKSSLEIMHLSMLSSLESFNEHISNYPNLKKLTLQLTNPEGKIDEIKSLKKLNDLYITIHQKVSKESNYYKIITIADYSMHKYRSDESITENQLKETLAEYNAFLEEN